MDVKFDYTYLREFIRVNYKTLTNFANSLEISLVTLNERLTGKSYFKQVEIFKVYKENNLDISDLDKLFFLPINNGKSF